MVKQEFYEKLRLDRLEKLSEERRNIINAMSGEGTQNGEGDPVGSEIDPFTTPKSQRDTRGASTANRSAMAGMSKSAQSGRPTSQASSRFGGSYSGFENRGSSVDTERKRLEVLRKRQEKELEQMVNYETKRQSMQNAAQEKLRVQRKKDLHEKKEKARKEIERQKMQREREMQRLAEEERLEATARQAASMRYRSEQQQLKRERERLRKLHNESHMRDLERMHKAEEARRMTEMILTEQQRQLQERQRTIERNDKERQEKIEMKRVALARENEEKRQQAMRRLEQAAENNRAILISKRHAYEEKTRTNERRRMEHEEERRKAAHVKHENDLQRERRRRAMFAESQEIERRRIDTIQKKQDEAEQNLQKVKKERAIMANQKRMHKQLIESGKMAKVESMRRQQAYQKEMALLKIEEETARTRKLLEERMMAREKRKMANVQTSFMRQQLMTAIEKLQVKKAWSKVDLSNGTLTLDQLQRVVSGPPSPWRENHSSRSSRGSNSKQNLCASSSRSVQSAGKAE